MYKIIQARKEQYKVTTHVWSEFQEMNNLDEDVLLSHKHGVYFTGQNCNLGD